MKNPIETGCRSARARAPLAVAALALVAWAFAHALWASEPSAAAPVAPSDEIRLGSRAFTPPAGVPKTLAAQLGPVIARAGAGKARAHVLVQLYAPPEAADRRRLSEQGIELLEPISRRVWRAAVTQSGAERLASTKEIRWADRIQPADKLAESARPGLKPMPYQLRPGDRIAYSVLFHQDVAAEEVRALGALPGVELEQFDAKSFAVVRSAIVTVPAGGLSALAEADIVAWIEPSPPPDEDDNLLSAQPLSNVDDVQIVPFNLNGAGVAVGTWEAGDTIFSTHLDFTPRVIVEAGQSASNDDHASHVAGTIGASGANVVNAEGMAPQVTIASWDATNDAAEMTNAATSPGGAGQPTPIRASNHSYGSLIGWTSATGVFNNNQNLFGQYTNQSVGYDNVVALTGLIVVKSAGNDRDDVPAAPPPGQPGDCLQGGLGVAADCIEPRGSAKNVITVGAMSGAGAIGGFSGFGPTDDGRIKPDLVAQGVGMLSLASGNFFSDGNGDGIDDVPDSTTASTTMSGTSMSTPVVTGVVALLLEEATHRSFTMTPAAMKALLIETARDVQGIGQSNPGPDFATGWGIVDVESAVNLLRQSGLTTDSLAATGLAGAWTRTFFVPAAVPEIHLTLVWDDPAGVPGGQILTNDLDLRLIAPDGTQFTPWTLNAATPAVAAVRNGGNDAINNVEQVSVLMPMTGIWTAQVSANAGNLPTAPQTFAVAGVLPQSDVVLVMDRSGSMSLPSGSPGVTKIEALQSSANEFIDLLDLGGGHRLGLVQFEENLVPFVPPFDLQPLAAGNLGAAHTAIDGMVAGGWTNIIAGVDEAANQLNAIAAPLPRQAIVVFSDGQHNRPIGSDLNSIGATVSAGNFRFYSIGFGTDVDDAILTSVANANGGIHVNEQDLSPIQLTKYFLTVGALVHDLTVLADPTYQIGAGESATLSVGISKLDRSVIFAVNWTGQQASDVALTLLAPDRRCKIPLSDHPGLRTRNGDFYRLIRLWLPYDCRGLAVHEGQWAIRAEPRELRGHGKETVDLTILGDSRLKLEAKSGFGKGAKQLLLAARLVQDGKSLPDLPRAAIEAHVSLPLPVTGDSEKQDGYKTGDRPPAPPPVDKERRLVRVRLVDDGTGGDRTANDGIYTVALPLSALRPGLVEARLVATFAAGKLKLTREATTSYYVKP